MSFEPFGYRFEVTSPLSPAEAKTAIRSRKKNWFDPTNGARGWIAGPFVCLWFSAFDRFGPMLFGVISSDGSGARVRGRAGSDLNGIVMFSLLIPLMTFLTYKMIAEGSGSPRQFVVIGAVFLIGGPFIYWSAHKERREAEPLVRFLRDTLTSSGSKLRRKSAEVKISKGLTLTVGGENLKGTLTATSIHDALLGVGPGSFVILESGPETYIQTASRDGGYVVEKREGNGREHFRAVRQGDDPSLTKGLNDLFNFEEVREVFMAYASAASAPPFLVWERMLLNK